MIGKMMVVLMEGQWGRALLLSIPGIFWNWQVVDYLLVFTLPLPQPVAGKLQLEDTVSTKKQCLDKLLERFPKEKGCLGLLGKQLTWSEWTWQRLPLPTCAERKTTVLGSHPHSQDPGSTQVSNRHREYELIRKNNGTSEEQKHYKIKIAPKCRGIPL